MNSFIIDTNHFLQKIKSLDQLSEGHVPSTIDALGLYPNIPYEEDLTSLRTFLDTKTEKKSQLKLY